MDDLVQWLGAQLDDDERLVRDQLCVNCGNPTAPLESPLGVTGYTHEGGWEGRRCPGRLVGAERVQNPARVLRETDAKRRIVDRYAWLREHGDTGGTAWVLPLLALPYADRPGYREEWRP